MRRRGKRIPVQAPAEWPAWAELRNFVDQPRPGVALTLTGTPRTKKNNSVMVNETTIVPSRAWRRWAKGCEVRMQPPPGAVPMRLVPVGFAPLYDLDLLVWPGVGLAMLPNVKLNCAALVYRDADVGDAVGFYQAIGDLLQLRRVVSNDKLIAQWDGSRLLLAREDWSYPKAGPRVDLVLTPV